MKKKIIACMMTCFFLVPFLTTASAEEIGCLSDNSPPEIEWWSHQVRAVKGFEYSNAFTADFIDHDHDECRVVAQIKHSDGKIIDTVHSDWNCYYCSGSIPYTYNQEIGTRLRVELWVEDAKGAESRHVTGSVDVIKSNSKAKFTYMYLLARLFDRAPLLKQLFLNSGFFDRLLGA